MNAEGSRKPLNWEQRLFLGMLVVIALWVALITLFQKEVYNWNKAAFLLMQEGYLLDEVAELYPNLAIGKSRAYARAAAICLTNFTYSRISTGDVAKRVMSFGILGDEAFENPIPPPIQSECVAVGKRTAGVDEGSP